MLTILGSLLQVEWTAQHGCGQGHPNVDCDVVLQYMCSPKLRDGIETRMCLTYDTN